MPSKPRPCLYTSVLSCSLLLFLICACLLYREMSCPREGRKGQCSRAVTASTLLSQPCTVSPCVGQAECEIELCCFLYKVDDHVSCVIYVLRQFNIRPATSLNGIISVPPPPPPHRSSFIWAYYFRQAIFLWCVSQALARMLLSRLHVFKWVQHVYACIKC